MRDRASEVVETLARRRIDIWRGYSTRMVSGKQYSYNFLWFSDNFSFRGVVAEKQIEKIILLDRTSCQQMPLRLLIGRKILYIVSSYGPHSGLSQSQKDNFFFNLLSSISVVSSEEMLLVCGDLNGHVGKTSSGFEGIHVGHDYGIRNSEGTRVLELCAVADLVITNTLFTKSDNQFLTYHCGNACSQVDYILV